MKLIRIKNDRATEKILVSIMSFFAILIRSVSLKASAAIARFLGDFVFYILQTRRKLVIENLSRAFPDKDSSEINAKARQVYRNQAENIIETVRLPMIKTAEDAARFLELDTKAILSKTIDQKKGGVLVSAHFGNWELLAFCSGLLMHSHTIVVKELTNKAIDRRMNEIRTLRGNQIVYDNRALREGLRTLQQGGILTLLGDQSDPSAGFFTEFMGRRTSVFLGPAFFALKAGVPLFVALCRRVGNGRYVADIEEIDTTGFGTSKTDIEEIARRYTRIIEKAVYQYPEEWFWLHNRWKVIEPVPEGLHG
ncbi:MAG: lysophospholipid acyltransferase family protein [Chlorobium sp.]|nr:MAG: lysophospholipid acyltransferase family protein [Chlorobium sp.]